MTIYLKTIFPISMKDLMQLLFNNILK